MINKEIIKWGCFFIVAFVLFGCEEVKKENGKITENLDKSAIEEKLYRPKFHFTPKANWMNDPNGMFYLNGKYHLYFQYYPDDNVWGPMHWGHAVSTDMVKWEEQEIAIYPDSLGYIFSGSAIVDTHNTSGFGSLENPPVIAIYTYHDPKGEKEKTIDYQSQAIAYSLDEGYTWTKYDGNPVIPNPGIKDFRDPKVIWDQTNEQWLMVLATVEKTLFYSSQNLKKWKLISSFGEGLGAHDGVWECPDFFPMKVEGTSVTKWVLIQSLNPGGRNGGSGTQYFIGDFDGNTFKLDGIFKEQLNEEGAIWLDFGKDNYAGVTWSNIPDSDGRKLFMGWMSNWEYAQIVPTDTWRSTMTVARELQLTRDDESYKITAKPVIELDKYISNVIEKKDFEVDKTVEVLSESDFDISAINIQFTISRLKNDRYTFSFYNDSGDVVSFGLDNRNRNLFIDRSKSGKIEFSKQFAANNSKVQLKNEIGELDVQVIFDKTSIELFYNNGEIVMTEIFFPSNPLKSFSIGAENSKVIVNNFKAEALNFKK